ncbi:MAG: RsmB/NOP family class I SAM-dependent RNA methyltransferase [Spirochaetes bacterium]|nr:RsmB/NOP family class I SAM-dependent RNA methyltransferase [Spirochaetota bacterium]
MKANVLFDEFYRSFYSDRWLPLKASMLSPVFFIPFQQELKKPYFLNLASYLAVRSLGEVGNQEVLDLCAAPGGKTLVLASSLGPEGFIVANERSSARRSRLKRVLEEYLSPEKLSRIKITGHDAGRWGLYEQDRYDLILLDVPCSSERHLLERPSHLKKWSTNRTRQLAQQAYAMVLSALMALKPGGKLLYCTCALSPLENDGVMERVWRKKGKEVKILPIEIQDPQVVVEPTKFGVQILPDLSHGAGPLYLSLLTKQGPNRVDQEERFG